MPEVLLRKKLTCVEEIFHEGGPPSAKPLRRAAVIAVIRNPYAGSYVADIETFMEDNAPGLTIHEMGTARMGRDRKTSVLNAHNQAHDVKNLFVTDGACMTSSACVNPSLTYMALTARACDYAVGLLKRGEL